MFNWPVQIAVFIATVFDAIMDSVLFHRWYNIFGFGEYWQCDDLYAQKKKLFGNDAWHDAKKLMQLSFIVAIWYAQNGISYFDLILIPVVILITHQTFLHYIFKRRT